MPRCEWVGTVCTAVGFIAGWLVKIWLSRQERKKLTEENRQMKYRANVQSCAEHIHMMANEEKGREHTHDVLFSEDEIYDWAREVGWGEFAQAALEELRNKGRAELSPIPNHYYIDRPKF